jgi:undecaprenyl diphosphate synthase
MSSGPSSHPEPDPATATASADRPAVAAPCPPDHLPRHVAIIMDGNGRWARQRRRPRLFGHRAGARSVRTCVRECASLGIEALTLYSFSSENWKRPEDEVRGLMDLLVRYLASERQELMERGVRFRQIGRRDRLSPRVLAAIEQTEELTAGGDGLTLSIALDYGSRDEIVAAARSLAHEAVAGTLDPDTIDEAMFSSRLTTAGLPDPDLLIRTAGEHRLSNYLLWQISYAELHVCDVCWPDFGRDELHAAIADFAGRSRRFGSLVDQVGAANG